MSTQKIIKYSFIDSDPIAYQGACICQKATYRWVKEDGSEETDWFKSAREAKEFMELMEMQGENEGWVREVGVSQGTPEDARKAVDGVVKDYMDTAITLTKNKKLIFKGYLTPSTIPKTKSIKGLENQYQGNRDPSNKPSLLGFCRDYLQEAYPWVVMAADGFEADTHIVAMCERYGTEAVGQFIDKDLAQMEGGIFIDMKRPRSVRELTYTTELGAIYFWQNARGVNKVMGHGFKWLLLQAVAGDTADGYKGLMGMGDKGVMKILVDLPDKKACMSALYDLYLSKLSKGMLSKEAKAANAQLEAGFIKYISWDGQRKKLNAKELLNQHLFLAYQERGSTDSICVDDYLGS